MALHFFKFPISSNVPTDTFQMMVLVIRETAGIRETVEVRLMAEDSRTLVIRGTPAGLPGHRIV